jgi:predicted ArsR family transcriptional regulator
VLRALTEGVDRGEPGTAAHVAALVGAHPNGVRRHLEALVEDGMATPTAPQPTSTAGRGRGRPSTSYAVTPSGRAGLAAATAPISGEYLGMAAAFATDLAERSETPADQALTIGRSWGRSLAAQRPATQPPKEQLVTLLDGLGFSPLRRPDGDVALRTCPLLEAARANPEVLCHVHLGLVQGASAAYGGADAGGELHAFAEPGACVLRLP